jgi:hypothetical protein
MKIFPLVGPAYRDEVLTRLAEIKWIESGSFWSDKGCDIRWTELGRIKMRSLAIVMELPVKPNVSAMDAFTGFFTNILTIAPELLEKDFSTKAFTVLLALVNDCAKGSPPK